MIYGSVCSGIEAATVAWHPLGWKAAWLCEFDKFPSAVLKHHYPDVPNLGDMTKIEERPEYETPIDLLVGGTPCQSFSIAGLRKGLDDERGNLALKFCRILAEKQPRWFVWENVPGVLSSNGGRDFGAILAGFQECGYGFAYRILDAQHFGVAQRRRRVFAIGYLGDWRAAAAVLFERKSVSGYPAPRREKGKDIAPTLDARAGRSGETSFATSGGLVPNHFEGGPHPSLSQSYNTGGIGQSNQELFSQRGAGLTLHPEQPFKVANTLTHRMGKGINTTVDEGQTPVIAHTLRAEGFDASEDGTGRQNIISVTPINSQIAMRHEALGKGTGLGVGAAGDPQFTLGANHCHAVAVALRGRDGGAVAEIGGDVSNALRASQGGGDKAHVLTSSVRRLTPRECERLQGFPDDYTAVPDAKGKPAADGPRYKALGNSMAVPVMAWIGRRIQMVDAILQAECS